MTKDEFYKAMTADLKPPPSYFFHDAVMNKSGYESFDDILKRSLVPVKPTEISSLSKDGTLILDTRAQPNVVKDGFIKDSIAISLQMPFAVWVGTLLPPHQKLVILCDPGKEEESVTRLARVGYQNCVGYVEGGIKGWVESGGKVEKMKVYQPKDWVDVAKKDQQSILLDIRNPPEWQKDGIYHKTDMLVPLGQLQSKLSGLDKSKTYHLLCGAGVRAKVAYTMMEKAGFKNMTVIEGGAPRLKQDVGNFVEWKPTPTA